MDKTKPVEPEDQQIKYEKLLTEIFEDNGSNFDYSSADFSEPDKGGIDGILRQRHGQRKWLFRYALGFSSLTFVGLAGMLIAQGIYKVHHGTALFGNVELGTVGVGVFVQFLGLLKIITDSLWNDKPYLDSGALHK